MTVTRIHDDMTINEIRAARAADRLTAVRSELSWEKAHDKYRRPTIALRRSHFDADGAFVGIDYDIAVVVTLPRVYVEQYGADRRYLVNVRGRGENGRGEVSHFGNRNAAKRHAEATAL